MSQSTENNRGSEDHLPKMPIDRGVSPDFAHNLFPLLSILCLLLAVGVVYWPTAIAMDSIWRSNSGTYQDGYLVLLASLWLVVRDRSRFAATELQPATPAIFVVMGLSFAWLWAWRSAIQELHMELVPLLLLAAALAACGRQIARQLIFPIGFLYFALPIWDHIRRVLQAMSARATAGMIWATGLPAYVRGDFIHLPWGILHIEGGCSGLNTLIVLLALTTLYVHVNEIPFRRRLQLLSIAVVLALLVNWLRIFVITAVAYYSEMHSSLVENHKWFGWVLFVVTFAGFLWWAERTNSNPTLHTFTPGSTPAEAKAGHNEQLSHLGLTIVALAILPLISYGMDWVRAHHGASARIRIEWPSPASPWAGPQSANSVTWRPRFTNASGESLVKYTDSQFAIQAFAVAYRVQTQDHKLLGYRNTLFSGSHRLSILTDHTVIASSGTWREAVVTDSLGRRSLIWSRFRIGKRHFTYPRIAQAWYGLVALVDPPLSSLSAMRTACVPTCRAAAARLDSVSEWLHPTLQSAVLQPRSVQSPAPLNPDIAPSDGSTPRAPNKSYVK